MTIELFLPQALNELGQRSGNEDACYPAKGKATAQDRLFLVCDGVGGASKGEVASHMLVDGLSKALSGRTHLSEADIDSALRQIEAQFDRHLARHPEAKGMSTTLTLLHFGSQGAAIAWVGDSRVYHFRGGDCLFESRDHSLVAELLAQGHITAEQAATHPQRNIILRAVKGSSEPADVDMYHSPDLKAGDYFLLCSDGILESVDNKMLSEWFAEGMDPQKVKDAILQKCETGSKDNFTCYIIQLSGVNGASVKAEPVVAAASTTATPPPSPPPKTEDSSPSPASGGLMKKLRPVLMIGLLMVAVFLLIKVFSPGEKEGLGQWKDKANAYAEQEEFTKAIKLYDSLMNLKTVKADEELLEDLKVGKEYMYAFQKRAVRRDKWLNSAKQLTELKDSADRHVPLKKSIEEWDAMKKEFTIEKEKFTAKTKTVIDSLRKKIGRISSVDKVNDIFAEIEKLTKAGDCENARSWFKGVEEEAKTIDEEDKLAELEEALNKKCQEE